MLGPREGKGLRLFLELAVEVVSPHDSPRDLAAKVGDWLAAGTRLVWVVDPTNRSLTAHASDGSSATYRDGDDVPAGIAVPGLSLPLDQIFV